MSKARQRAQAHYEMRRETIRLHHARQRYEQATSEIEHKSVRRRPCKMVAIALFLVAALVAADFAQARGGGGAGVAKATTTARPARPRQTAERSANGERHLEPPMPDIIR